MIKYACIVLSVWMALLTANAQTLAAANPSVESTEIQKPVMFTADSSGDDANDDDASLQADIAAASEVTANTATLQGDSSEDFDRD